MQELHQLKPSEIPAAAKMVARAFADDPVFTLFFHSRTDQIKYGHLFYEFLLKFGLRTGQVYASSQNLEGVIMWIKQENQESQAWDALRSGLLSIWKRLKIETVLEVTRFTSQIHHKHVGTPHCYLQLLAVDPSYQNQGIGKKLML